MLFRTSALVLALAVSGSAFSTAPAFTRTSALRMSDAAEDTAFDKSLVAGIRKEVR